MGWVIVSFPVNKLSVYFPLSKLRGIRNSVFENQVMNVDMRGIQLHNNVWIIYSSNLCKHEKKNRTDVKMAELSKYISFAKQLMPSNIIFASVDICMCSKARQTVTVNLAFEETRVYWTSCSIGRHQWFDNRNINFVLSVFIRFAWSMIKSYNEYTIITVIVLRFS